MHDPHVISADGSRILFDLDNGGGASNGLYARVNGRTTVAVSESQRSGDPPGARSAILGGASVDGKVVYFVSDVNLTDASDTHARNSLYRYDSTTRRLVDLTVSTDPGDAVEGANVLRVLNVADDGAYVYFTAGGNLAPGGISGRVNIYMWHDGTTRHVATLASDVTTIEFRGPQTWAASPSGEYFAFTTHSNALALTGQDTSGAACPRDQPSCREVFVYDARGAALTCASCPRSGLAPRGSARMGSDNDAKGQYWRHFVLDDGRVFFDSPDPLVGADANGRFDVYVWQFGTRRLISPGTADADARFSDAATNGDSVFFTTSEQVVSQDVDSIADLYVARGGGGFGPSPPLPACDSDECQGPPAGRPALPALVTTNDAARATAPRRPLPRAALISLSASTRARLASGRVAVVGVRTTGAGRVTLVARARIGGRAVAVARAARTADRAGVVKLRLRISRVALKAMRRRGSLRLVLAVTFSGQTRSSVVMLKWGR